MTTTIELSKEQLMDVMNNKLEVTDGKVINTKPLDKVKEIKEEKEGLFTPKKKEKKKRDFELVPEQRAVVDDIKKWFHATKGYSKYEFGGFAGVGKSTVIDFLLEELDLKPHQVRLCAPTGTASLVLRDKTPDFSSSTLHKLFYTPKRTKRGLVFEPSPLNIQDAKLLIGDEFSMVGRRIGEEILGMARKAKCKFLITGDPGQLPPVKDEEYFFLNPDAMLTRIMRQAAGNPIIDLSMKIREASENGESYRFTPTTVGKNLFVRSKSTMTIPYLAKVIDNGGTVIVGANKTRASLNAQIREQLGFTQQGVLMNGEKICIKKNYPGDEDGIEVTNGMVGTVSQIKKSVDDFGEVYDFLFTPDRFEGSRKMRIRMDILFEEKNAMYKYINLNRERKKTMLKEIDIGVQAVLGYAITCHASQGSQWKTVVLFDESYMFGRDQQGKYHEESYIEQNRWSYTAVTRAEENLVVFI